MKNQLVIKQYNAGFRNSFSGIRILKFDRVETDVKISKMRPVLVIWRGVILLHSARKTLQNLIDLRYQTLAHPPYFPHLSPTITIFSNICTHFLRKKFYFKKEVESAFKYFSASKPFEFYCTSINNFVNQWQKYIDVHGSYFDWLKACLNSLFQG